MQLAETLPTSGRRKQLELAQKKIRNWLADRDHPRATSAEVGALASALGCRPTELIRFVSRYRWSRSSPRKARLVTDLIRGRRVDEASALLQFSPKRAAVFVRKALDAAVADAEQLDADVDSLVITESRVDEGVIIKRFRPKDRGRAHPIQKKTSHIIVGVEEKN
ncbi:MAG: 50S ribosomal protein L22 [Phycisphaerales bacterium]